MRLQIILIHDINSMFIRQLQKQRIRRIMGGADGINIVLLAQQHILLDLLRRHGIAIFRTGIMVIDAMEFDLPSVDKKNISLDLHRSKTDPLLDT